VSAKRCVGCGSSVPPHRKVYFHPVRGGVVCTPCGGGPLLLRAETARLLAASSREAVSDAEPEDLAAAHRALDEFELWHVARCG
jgi:recombinational DNA repair protein (RecF pathway)